MIPDFLLWPVNGLLVAIYLLVERFFSLLLLGAYAPMVLQTHREHQAWAFAAGIIALLASLLAPNPVPLFLAILAGAGWPLRLLEKFNRLVANWHTIRNLALYGAAGIGYWAWTFFRLGDMASSDPMLATGMTYFNGLIGIAMYVIPLGFLAWSMQNIFAHPPMPGGSPEDLIATVRSRGQGR